MPKAKKVYTPGSKPAAKAKKQPDKRSSAGRPKKMRDSTSFSRKGNYRNKYSQQNLELAIKAVKENRMAISKAAKHFQE
jgi:hypothetical protein